nr:hypothetical protein [Tanacetum cinerariifolium]
MSIEKRTGKEIITFHADRGGEITSHDFNRFCYQEGIARMLTAPYAPQQNGIVELRNHTLLEMTRCIMKARGVPHYIWGEAVPHATYIINRTPTRAWLKPLVYLGKEPSLGGFGIYNPRENKIIINAYVVFDEKKVTTVHNPVIVDETPFHVTSPERDEDEYESDVTPISVRRSTRNKVLPTRLVDYQLNVHELMLTLDEEPRNYNEAKLNPKWLKAMKTELESIVKNNTWKLVPLPKGFVPIGLKWLFKIKRNADGLIMKYKARLVAKGYVQQPRIDFDEVFAPKLDGTLKKMSFLQCVHEKAVYRRVPNEEFIIVTVYGDDLFVSGASIEVSQGKNCVEIKQERYAMQILKEAGMKDCITTLCPMEPGLKLSKAKDEPEVKATQYRKVVGCLRYLLHTRPDLTYSVSVVSRYMQSPSESHARAIKQSYTILKVIDMPKQMLVEEFLPPYYIFQLRDSIIVSGSFNFDDFHIIYAWELEVDDGEVSSYIQLFTIPYSAEHELKLIGFTKDKKPIFESFVPPTIASAITSGQSKLSKISKANHDSFFIGHHKESLILVNEQSMEIIF